MVGLSEYVNENVWFHKRRESSGLDKRLGVYLEELYSASLYKRYTSFFLHDFLLQ